MSIILKKENKILEDDLNDELEDDLDDDEYDEKTNYNKGLLKRIFFIIALILTSYNLGKLNGEKDSYSDGVEKGMQLQSSIDDTSFDIAKSYLDEKATKKLTANDLECFKLNIFIYERGDKMSKLYNQYFNKLYYDIKEEQNIEVLIDLDPSLDLFFDIFDDYTNLSQNYNEKIGQPIYLHQLDENKEEEEKNKVFIKY